MKMMNRLSQIDFLKVFVQLPIMVIVAGGAFMAIGWLLYTLAIGPIAVNIISLITRLILSKEMTEAVVHFFFSPLIQWSFLSFWGLYISYYFLFKDDERPAGQIILSWIRKNQSI